MEQRSDNWLDWRKAGIGSSDAPVIMRVSPWKTPYQLWQEKTGQIQKEHISNWAQDRGNRIEPIARAKYELTFDLEMGPATCQHFQLPWLRASMDGWNPLLKRGLEIKVPGKADHEMAVSGHIPEKYLPQVMHQFIVTGAEIIDYYSYYVAKDQPDDKGHGVRVEVKPDMGYIQRYLVEAKKFWMCVTDKIAPEFDTKDFKTIRSADARKACEAYKIKAKELQAHIAELGHHEAAVLAFASGHERARIKGAGIEIINNKISHYSEGKDDDGSP